MRIQRTVVKIDLSGLYGYIYTYIRGILEPKIKIERNKYLISLYILKDGMCMNNNRKRYEITLILVVAYYEQIFYILCYLILLGLISISTLCKIPGE